MNESRIKSDLSEHLMSEIDDWVSRYPADQKQSAVLGALRALQHEEGYLPIDKMDAIEEYLEMPSIAVCFSTPSNSVKYLQALSVRFK